MTTFASQPVDATGAQPAAHGVAAAAITHDHGHVVSWPAVFGGAVAAAALSLILLVGGVGLGLSAVSPWAARGAGSTAVGVGTIVWVIAVAVIASGMGGYLSGRLRSRWAQAHADEVYFRDTAHGFLAWAVATLLTAGLLTSTVGGILGAGAEAGGTLVGAAGTAATTAAGAGAAVAGKAGSSPGSPVDYLTDSLFRQSAAPADPAASAPTAAPTPDAASSASTVAEAGRILAHALATGTLPPDDSRYLGGLVAGRTSLTQADAEKRVTETYAKARQSLQDAETAARSAADQARKAAAYGSLWIFVSLLSGAFAASLMATVGGRRRDL